MQLQNKMSTPDFQKLLKIALADLAVRQTIVENEMQHVNEEMRSLEKDDHLDRLDLQLLTIKNDYEHYLQFVDPDFTLDITKLYAKPAYKNQQ
jgi:D-ribose pyranose/furanose isomerase RbsD